MRRMWDRNPTGVVLMISLLFCRAVLKLSGKRQVKSDGGGIAIPPEVHLDLVVGFVELS
ncbi:hypothetical protein GCM10019815_06170 [Pediococcus damnosus]